MLRDKRNNTHEDILKGVFISKKLEEHGRSVDTEIQREITKAGFRSAFWGKRNMSVDDNTLTYEHLAIHRIIDIKTRKSSTGIKRKKNHPIHNRILYGKINTLARELMFGFTQSVKEELQNKISGTI